VGNRHANQRFDSEHLSREMTVINSKYFARNLKSRKLMQGTYPERRDFSA